MILKSLAGLHRDGIVHGALSPSAVVWHSWDIAVKMSDLCCASTCGESNLCSQHRSCAGLRMMSRRGLCWP